MTLRDLVHNVHGFQVVGVVVVGGDTSSLRISKSYFFLPGGETGAACPAPLGLPSPPGCEKIFLQDTDGEILCQDDEDCPESLQWWDDQGDICSEPGNPYNKCIENR